MSGVCGVACWDGSAVRREWLEGMHAAAWYRAVDGQAVELRDGVGFGYLSHELTPERGRQRQPVVHAGSGVMLSGDLRLDNRKELVAALEAEGEESDCELLLASYLRWGERCVERLLGDFAWVLWDPRSASVMLARDAMGMRPLYYRAEARRVLWASEVKQILAVPGVERELNEVAVATHLSGSHVPLGMSFYRGIEQVEPGHLVRVRRDGVHKRRYWEIDVGKRLRYRREAEYGEHFRELFLQAVRCRLRSSKPVGISLSGGLDSGSVACAVGHLYERGEAEYRPAFYAYNWAFDELTQCDERAASGLVSRRYGIPTVEIPADDAWPLKHYPEHGPDIDEPYIFYYSEVIDRLLASAAASGLGVMMTGERGDACVDHWVYDYPGLVAALRFPTLFRELSSHARASGISLPRMFKTWVVKPILSGLGSTRRNAAPARRYPAYLHRRYAESPELAAARAAAMPGSEIRNEARRRRHMLIFSAMSARSVELAERDHARHGLAYADPWSDRRLAEFVVAMPQHLVHRFGDFKRIARQALGPILTDYLRQNSESIAKANPTPLFERGILEREQKVVEQLIGGSRAHELGFVDKEILLQGYRGALSGQPLPYDLWWFLTMEMWLRRETSNG